MQHVRKRSSFGHHLLIVEKTKMYFKCQINYIFTKKNHELFFDIGYETAKILNGSIKKSDKEMKKNHSSEISI